ncbi:MAG: peptide-methionine (S)-S-oxide reductase MsrA [Candidatus Eisenbacteria bacterium]|nr:peptide-methionine (S)-S-oxide reductase MsrA [Candidatus Eisenbacteria bacterium]
MFHFRPLIASAWLLGSVWFANFASAAAPAGAAPGTSTARADTAIFAGGCFWSMESQFEGVPGVLSVVSGYTGGRTANPTYEEVCSETTGHLEAVRIAFDPARIGYAELLDRYWHGIDPTQSDGQFCDRGESYTSAVFYRNAAQQRVALQTRAALTGAGGLKGRVVTQVRPAQAFWPAEEYHQDFARRNPERYRAYRTGCGRDRSLDRVWGARAVRPLAH